ncbi:uncharacterized protein LOC110191729 [Drosophila serrata]|uniref:uncharacterized protein LOC110191729 n=1 Tax=Drosophila serrata TaxID=7274 RepID=UPI000A1D03FA|nr:uncharacterized protein LOC110191729 [Drosophila serrata]
MWTNLCARVFAVGLWQLSANHNNSGHNNTNRATVEAATTTIRHGLWVRPAPACPPLPGQRLCCCCCVLRGVAKNWQPKPSDTSENERQRAPVGKGNACDKVGNSQTQAQRESALRVRIRVGRVPKKRESFGDWESFQHLKLYMMIMIVSGACVTACGAQQL